mmetsp:Transcript_18337/g.19104  ORF Transcript_18337/g.19104 Transcript_18337/m.19104 type:complete len:312 (+) Transcript_18337:48-983(+)
MKQYQGGLFSAPITNNIGDPYKDSSKIISPHGTTKGIRQFTISKGIPGKFNRLYEGETHIEPFKILAKERLKGKEKFLLPTGFKYSSPLKKSGSLGDYHGTFSKPIAHIPDGTGGTRGPREPVTEFQPKNIFTQPPKRASGAQGSTPKICFTEVEYVPSPYDAALLTERELHKLEKEKTQGRPPFKVSIEDVLSKPLSDTAETVNLSATSPIKRPSTAESATGEHRAFRPSSPSKVGGAPYGTIGEYPAHLADPYDEKRIRSATQSTRLLPMSSQKEFLEEKLKDRKSWAPSSPPKSTYTKSTLFHVPGRG